MLNKTILMGRMTRDPELRSTASGISVVSFSLAVERDFKNPQTGEKDVDFFDCVAWRNTADYVAKYFTKGRMAIIEGQFQTRWWEDNSGLKRRAIELIVSNIYFGDSKPQQEASQNVPEPSDFEGFQGMPAIDSDDIPF